MDEYIERNALIRQIICDMAEFVGAPNEVLKHDERCNYAIFYLKNAPIVDVVPVVRCRDCAVPHNKYTGCPKLNGLVTPPDFYCPSGERKDEVSK